MCLYKRNEVCVDEQDILKDAQENNLTCVTEMPYFEGDFWPNILEESIKEVEQEELEMRRREEEEAAADTEDCEPSVHGDRVEVGDRSVFVLGITYKTLHLCFLYCKTHLHSLLYKLQKNYITI